MKIENQVTSLELSKKLKELGVKQESLFYWVITLTQDYHISFYDNELPEVLKERNDCYSAFTVAELGEMLPTGYYTLQTKEDGWMCCARILRTFERGVLIQNTWGDTEADARAKMLIYLYENKLIP